MNRPLQHNLPPPPTQRLLSRQDTICHLFWQSQAPDTNGDGKGDCEGVTRILPQLKEMGFTAVWLAPFQPRGEEGYDIKDHLQTADDWGTLEQTKRLIECAGELEIILLCDFVLPHTSDENPMFIEALANPQSQYRNWYYFVEKSADKPPTETCSVFGDKPGSVWTWRPHALRPDGGFGMWTFNLFGSVHPALNFHNPEVVSFMIETMSYFADLGFHGARIDSARHTVLHPEISVRSEKVIDPEADYPWDRWEHSLTSNVIDDAGENLSANVITKIVKAVRVRHPGFYAVVENVGLSRAEQEAYFAGGVDVLDYGLSEPDTGIGFVKRNARQIASTLITISNYTETGRNFVPFNANHDAFPFAIYDPDWVGNSRDPDQRAVRIILTLVLTCPSGGPAILYGPPLGTGLAQDNGRDFMGRAAYRGVTRWDDTGNGGFCRAGINPYWPISSAITSVSRQLAQPDSTLRFARGLMEIRRRMVKPEFNLVHFDDHLVSYKLGAYHFLLNVGHSNQRFDMEQDSENYCSEGKDSLERRQLSPLGIVISGPGLTEIGLVTGHHRESTSALGTAGS